MLITFMHAYRPCWLQTRNRVCVTHPLAVYKTARCFPHFANQNVTAQALCAIYIISWEGSIVKDQSSHLVYPNICIK